MPEFLHTMVRITDPERSRAFYEALGFAYSRDLDIVRNGELEATNYFYSLGEAENVLELTYNHDGRQYELGTTSTTRSLSCRNRGSSPSGSRIASAKAARVSASSAIRTSTGSS